MTHILLYGAMSVCAVLAFPRVWLAAALAGAVVVYALWAFVAADDKDMASPAMIMIIFAVVLFLAMLGAISYRKRRAS